MSVVKHTMAAGSSAFVVPLVRGGAQIKAVSGSRPLCGSTHAAGCAVTMPPVAQERYRDGRERRELYRGRVAVS